jgi:hypothetical protein
MTTDPLPFGLALTLLVGVVDALLESTYNTQLLRSIAKIPSLLWVVLPPLPLLLYTRLI